MTKDEAIELLDNLIGMVSDSQDNDYDTALKMAIEALEQNQWVPCSERLPEFFEPVLTWDGRTYSVEKRLPYICDDDGEHIISDWWVSDDYDESESDYYPNLRDGAAIVWMPLPKAYEGREE